MSEILLINVSGQDKAGLTASLTSILARYEVNILDIGQAVIHNTLSLGMLIEIPAAAEPGPVLKDLVFRAHELGVDLDFQPVAPEDYNHWVEHQEKARFIITLLGRQISAGHISKIAAIITSCGLSIHDITRLSWRMPLDQESRTRRACIEFRLHGDPPDRAEMRAALMQTASELGIDIGFQEDTLFRRSRRLVAFDMDSTLIQQEVIDELAAVAGVGEQVAEITEQAMRGELDFKESLRRRLDLLSGLDEAALVEVCQRLVLTEGAERLIQNLKKLGYKIAIISGGFTYFGEYLQRRLGIDYVYANELQIVDKKVTGKVVGQIVDGARKAELLHEIARREGIRMEQVIAVGDGANDLPMLNSAGLGIAFHAKPVVRAGAEQAISTLGLDGVLYLMGIPDRETS
jgi:phosphoserine phosphatase